MLERDAAEIPDLRFVVELLIADPPHIAIWLRFGCTPSGEFLGLPVGGRRIVFVEHMFCRFGEGKIVSVWLMIDRAAIMARLAEGLGITTRRRDAGGPGRCRPDPGLPAARCPARPH